MQCVQLRIESPDWLKKSKSGLPSHVIRLSRYETWWKIEFLGTAKDFFPQIGNVLVLKTINRVEDI